MENEMDAEVAAMATIAKALDEIKADDDALKRVVRWAVDRYDPGASPQVAAPRVVPAGTSSTERQAAGQSPQTAKYGDVAELFDAARPRTDFQKAVVVGYWLMTGENQADFGGGDINVHLKNLGHGVGNITDALNQAIRKKPALVIQTAKSGSAKQARKKYKLTRAGVAAVQAMIDGTSVDEE